MKKLYVVGGPTATGKTKFAIKLAKKIDGLIINADSVQIYKYMNIGSNKGNVRKIDMVEINEDKLDLYDIENTGVKALMFNVVEPNTNFSIYDYQKLVLTIINYYQNKNLILVGGSGLYIDSILKDYEIPEKLNSELYEELSLTELQNKLEKEKPNIFRNLNNSDVNNPIRLRNLLLNKSEKKISNFRCNYDFYYPIFDREELYKKIDARVLGMIKEGLEEEVKNLIKMGYTLENKAMNATGYKQMFEFLNGEYKNLEECINKIQQAHRNYAKRQITWFEGEPRGYNLTKIDFSSYL